MISCESDASLNIDFTSVVGLPVFHQHSTLA